MSCTAQGTAERYSCQSACHRRCWWDRGGGSIYGGFFIRWLIVQRAVSAVGYVLFFHSLSSWCNPSFSAPLHHCSGTLTYLGIHAFPLLIITDLVYFRALSQYKYRESRHRRSSEADEKRSRLCVASLMHILGENSIPLVVHLSPFQPDFGLALHTSRFLATAMPNAFKSRIGVGRCAIQTFKFTSV